MHEKHRHIDKVTAELLDIEEEIDMLRKNIDKRSRVEVEAALARLSELETRAGELGRV